MKKLPPIESPLSTPILATEPGSWTLLNGELVRTPEPSDDIPPEEPGALLVIPPAPVEPPTFPPEL